MDMTNILLIAAMFIALGGMIFCNKKQEKFAAAKAVAVVLMLVVVGCGITLVMRMNGSGSTDALIANEAKFFASQGSIGGDFIKSKFGSGKVVVIANEGYENDKRMPAFVEAVKESTGSSDVVLTTITLPAVENPEFAPPISERMTAADFDALVNEHSDAAVVISLIGLPRDAPKLKLFKNAQAGKGPALLIIGYADMRGLGKAIEVGAIAGMITVKKKAVFNENPAPSDPKEAFALRYVLITKDNLSENQNLLPND